MVSPVKDDIRELLKTDKIKAVITDLDNTLWSGILAEKQKLVLNKNYYEFLRSLYAKGIQIIVVSKNDKPDILDTFKKLGVDEELFTIIISNWDPKHLNIERLINHAEFRPETVIFIDDNPLERTEAKTKVKSVHVIDILDWELLKDHPYIRNRENQSTHEIKTRINRYRTSFKMKELEQESKKDSIDFLNKLQREVSVGEIDSDNLDRFTRLFVETHRINFNPGKFADYDKALEYLHKRLNDGDKLYAISTNEGGYSLGLTGALIISIKDKKVQLTDGTYSCGIIGRDFEQKSLLVIIDKLRKIKIEDFYVDVTLTSTNKRVRECLDELGFIEKEKQENNAVYHLNLKKYKPPKKYEWIKVLNTPPELDYTGHPAVISFFKKEVKPLIEQSWSIVNLGSSRGEVLGHLQEEVRKEFYDFLANKNITYKKIDQEYYPDEQNIIGNAENLKDVCKDESQDLIIAVELLEHTEHFWKIITEIVRICKVGGFIFITVPSFNYPKHEYPIDLWRIGPKTLSSFFPTPDFKISKLEKEGDKETPRRSLILVQKLKFFSANYELPKSGKTDWKTGLTIFE